MVKLRTLFEVISTAKSEAEAQTLFFFFFKAMPDNTIGHSVPVYYLDGRTVDMMVCFPDGHEEKSGKAYPGLIQHIGE